ncbi:MAG: 16S rRNA (guanine(527)-N(7))-methyltransferase RsmG [Neisseriaceae bacterium]|nr:16S rRNA (guanine(527)-N(7))-methyltransferase RsmG [Neisseriaceae bacterium]MBP6862988.1 16S rRNA (guanine(527)-N(7))-methyltransferase RsmG [Neisseriaceae bacterium]
MTSQVSGQQQLQQGIDAMNLSFSEEQQAQMLAYVALLQKWNSTYNLTALRDEASMISHHVLDSLSLMPHLDPSKRMIDVGSGGGMPGILCAISYPEMDITLLDANRKKTTFLQQVVIELGLTNVQVKSCRVETLADQSYEIVTSRAFAELADFVNLTRELIHPQGKWLAMKGMYPKQEIDRLPDWAEVTAVRALSVPAVAAERHLVFMQKKEAL